MKLPRVLCRESAAEPESALTHPIVLAGPPQVSLNGFGDYRREALFTAPRRELEELGPMLRLELDGRPHTGSIHACACRCSCPPSCLVAAPLFRVLADERALTLAVLSVASPSTLTVLLQALSPGGSGPAIQLRFGRLLLVYYLAGMILSGTVGWGLWTLRNWARWISLGGIGISLVAEFAGASGVARSGQPSAIGLWLLRLSLVVLWTWYLFSRRVRSAFRSTPRHEVRFGATTPEVPHGR